MLRDNNKDVGRKKRKQEATKITRQFRGQTETAFACPRGLICRERRDCLPLHPSTAKGLDGFEAVTKKSIE